ncbi:MAG: DNA mismatch repair endonuclease MutL [Syntrophales bacterium]|nr:DNA mismatch repair endonuclease MutL [Syntrophales bacterium]
MSGKIVVLPEELTNKIAAGEVVERPASIVKELLENALDAGATDITIELERGGCGSIRITDNGEGMDAEDLPLAFSRYATSKIYQFDDIYRVKSFGFRGEALPSIASIARVEMVSRKRESASGTRVIVEAGQVKEIAAAGCPVGTSVLVSHIFDPVPVRKKFLKAEMTEQGHCLDVATRAALSHSEVKMKIIAKGKEILNIPATQDVSLRVSLVIGADFMNHILPLKGGKDNINVSGFACRPEFTMSSARHIYCYVNKRFIRDYLLNHAVMTAYRRLLAPRRYPAVILFIDLPPGEVDVNVHPAKMEVRFKTPREIYEVVMGTLTGALSGISPAAETTAAPVSSRGWGSQEKRRSGIEDVLRRYTISSGKERLFFEKTFNGKREEQVDASPPKETSEEDFAFLTGISFSDLEYAGQVAGTYLIFSSPEGLILIDQHAAHERILFEKFRGKTPGSSGEKAVSQRLLIPEVISLPQKDFSFLMEAGQILEDAGIEVEPFGTNTVVVKSVPAMLPNIEPKTVIMDLLGELSETGHPLNLQEKKDKIFAFLACRGAVKANQTLSEPEVDKLCADLDATPFSSTCPHGRPVYISFSFNDIERMFKRR